MIPEKTHSEGLPTMDKKDLNELAIEAAQLTPAARRAAMQVPMTKSLSNRGFGYIRFRDRYWQRCRVSESSLATEACVWVGEDDNCMHLTQAQAADLAVLLAHFGSTGELP
jgi:hypothetical protein